MSFSLDKALRKAQIYLKAGDLDEAKATYKLILAKSPKNVRALQGYEKTKTVVGSKVSFNKELKQDQVQDLLDLYNLGRFKDAFVFCCFERNYKITPVEFDIWMRLLHHVEGSVLWLLKSIQWSNANLRLETE